MSYCTTFDNNFLIFKNLMFVSDKVSFFFKLSKGWFPLGVDCRRGAKHSFFLYLVLRAKRARSAHKTK